MKKRLLITSIVMMLVVAVALSTATYAWFTSNGTVTASTMTLQAGTNNEDALGIGWTGSAAGTSITSPVYGLLEPMAPTELTNNSTTSESIEFYSSSVKQEAGSVKFNKNGTQKYPITYKSNPGNVGSFYIRNLSNANKIDKVRVTAVFDQYCLTKDTTFNANKTYYKLSGDQYQVQDMKSADFSGTLGANEVKAGTAVTADTYYEQATGNDMVRIALFIKRYSKATGTADGTSKYYKYDSVTNVMDAGTQLSSGADVTGYYTLDHENHNLLGVLGNANSVGSYTSVGNNPFDMNEIYFERTGDGTNTPYVYTKKDNLTSSNYADYKANLFTCSKTAAYGEITADKDVKALGYYNTITTSIDFAVDLLPGEQIDIVALAWLDGTILDDARQGEMGQVSLKFDSKNANE